MIACDWKELGAVVEQNPEEEYIILVGSKEAIDVFDGMIPIIPPINRTQLIPGSPLTIEDPSMFSCVGSWPITQSERAVLLQKLFLTSPDFTEVDETEF